MSDWLVTGGAGGAGFTLSSAHWPEVEAGPRRLLVVPIGSLEQHGAHLPLDTDTRIAVAVASRACAGRSGVGLAPPIAIGASGEHADFPGTLSIGSVALSTLLVELGRQAALHWPAVLLVYRHGGHGPATRGGAPHPCLARRPAPGPADDRGRADAGRARGPGGNLDDAGARPG